MIDYFAIHKRRQQIARNNGVCTQLQHAINIDAHEAILVGCKASYVLEMYGIDFGAYNRLKHALLSDKPIANFKQFETAKKSISL